MPVFNESVVIGYGIVGAKIGIFSETAKKLLYFLPRNPKKLHFHPDGHHAVGVFIRRLIGTFS